MTDYEAIIDRDKQLIKIGIQNAEKRIASFLEMYAKNNHIYKNRTGQLQRTTHFKTIAQDIIKGYTDSFYDEYVIKPRKTWKGDDFLARAVEENLDTIQNIIIDEINKSLEI